MRKNERRRSWVGQRYGVVIMCRGSSWRQASADGRALEYCSRWFAHGWVCKVARRRVSRKTEKRERAPLVFWGGTPTFPVRDPLSFTSYLIPYAMSPVAPTTPGAFLNCADAVAELKKYTRGDGLSAKELVRRFFLSLCFTKPSLPACHGH